VARGGGSFEDLFPFNDEGLARTLSASKVPVISAVGHETDFTICDFVADRRAATPSEAAEIVIATKQELGDKLEVLHKRLARAAQYRLLLAHNALSRLAQHAAFARMRDSTARRQQQIDDKLYRLVQAQAANIARMRRQMEQIDSRLRHQDIRIRMGEVRRELNAREAGLSTATLNYMVRHRNQVVRLHEGLGRSMETIVLRRRSGWSGLDRSLQALSPKAILSRGYALVFDEKGAVVKTASQLTPGDRVRTELSRGRFDSEVQRVEAEPTASYTPRFKRE